MLLIIKFSCKSSCLSCSVRPPVQRYSSLDQFCMKPYRVVSFPPCDYPPSKPRRHLRTVSNCSTQCILYVDVCSGTNCHPHLCSCCCIPSMHFPLLLVVWRDPYQPPVSAVLPFLPQSRTSTSFSTANPFPHHQY